MSRNTLTGAASGGMPRGSERVTLNEVAPRDGLQIEPRFVPTEEKIRWIDALSRTGVAKIEATSFTSPKAIPTLRDAEVVMQGIERVPGVDYVVLVPNEKGAERALAVGVDEINLVLSASDSHGRANLRMSAEQSLSRFAGIVEITRGSGVHINASISTAFGCPFEGAVPQRRVMEIIERLLALGVQGISLCDTTGMANPQQVATLRRGAGALAVAAVDATRTTHPRDGAGQCLQRLAAGGDAASTLPSVAWAAAPSPRVPAAMSAPRIWPTCLPRWAWRPASTSRACSRWPRRCRR
ncbi:hydroxymethylglutaryl-CoA lyase [Salinicola tamaricis]|uniref:hydroxymethylglutaryl-CoA lyase n=1 Tax=Salinicola tamaricis TaxID=1771309 RepID=UPI0030F467FC